jgi:DNA adenine methylase
MNQQHAHTRHSYFSAEPFLKWPGAKTRMADAILTFAPHNRCKRIVEPMAGTAAFSLAAAKDDVSLYCETFVIRDSHPDLISVLKTAQEFNPELIAEVETLFIRKTNSERAYYRLREEFNLSGSADRVRRAALFIYLNKHGYGGLCRYNKRGEFNVPYAGDRSRPAPVRALQAFGEFAAKADIGLADFRVTLAECGAGDLVYCDPPYLPAEEGGSYYDRYNAVPFRLAEHIELYALARKAVKRGAVVLITNSASKAAEKLAHDACAETCRIEIPRHICKRTVKKAVDLLAVLR